MSGALDSLLNAICHRGGPHADALPLCLRCSCVYAGAMVGLLFEASLLRLGRGRPTWTAYGLNVAALALMGVVGFGGLYGVLDVPLWLKALSALLFGAALAFFAVASLAQMTGWPRGAQQSAGIWRGALYILLAGAALGLAQEWECLLRALGWLAAVGLPAIFLMVNASLAVMVMRRVRAVGPGVKPLVAIAVAVALTAVEWGVFVVWRRGF